VTGGRFATRLLSRSWLSNDTFEIELERPPGFRFDPGQGIRVSHSALEREYSMVCGPEDERLALCVQRVPGGALSPALASMEVGSSLAFSGPHGYFTLQSASLHSLFVATGTGIAPFVSMVRAGARGFALLQGAATQADLHYRPIVQAAAGRYVGCLSRESPCQSPAPWMFPGRVTDFLRDRMPPGIFDFYVCGKREMVRDVVSIADERFPDSRVFFEIFS
jgi:benzoate/toluate 1,2-dioxygenase reductase component